MSETNRLPQTRTLVIMAAAAAVVLSLWGYDHSRRAAVEHRASAAASAVSLRSVQVGCPGHLHRIFLKEIREGSVRFGADGEPSSETKLSGGACDGLRYVLDRGAGLDLQCLAYHCPKDAEQGAMGLVVLAHEAVHLRGVTDEARTECEARLQVPAVARQFGLGDASVRALVAWQATDWADMLPGQYRGSC